MSNFATKMVNDTALIGKIYTYPKNHHFKLMVENPKGKNGERTIIRCKIEVEKLKKLEYTKGDVVVIKGAIATDLAGMNYVQIYKMQVLLHINEKNGLL